MMQLAPIARHIKAQAETAAKKSEYISYAKQIPARTFPNDI